MAGNLKIAATFVAMLVLAAFLSGCAGTADQLEGQWHKLTAQEYFVKKRTMVWARPDRTSKDIADLEIGYKVLELTRNKVGWSKIKMPDSSWEGWVPTSTLTKTPINQLRAPAKAEPVKQDKQPAKDKAAPAESDAPAAQPQSSGQGSGSLLSPKEAQAAEQPPAKPSGSPQERKADPKKFEPL